MTSQTHRVEFFYDISSPYAYLASTQIDAVAQRCGVSVRWRPFLLGGVFQATQNVMPASVPAKAAWMFKDLKAWAKYYGVPFHFPAALFPGNSLRAIRACVWAIDQGEGKQRALASALFEKYWVQSQDPSSEETVKAAAEIAGLDPEAAWASTQDADVKQALRANTEEAVARGAFGAPVFFLDGDAMMLWGNDRLPMLEFYFKGQDA